MERNAPSTFKLSMEIALQRIQQCVDGILNLSQLGLTELPPLPDGLIELRCDQNHLISLPPLPEGLLVLRCSSNQLTILPELPFSLQELDCSSNRLTSGNGFSFMSSKRKVGMPGKAKFQYNTNRA